jgi:hypothetical protein
MNEEREKQYGHLAHLIHRGGGRVVSPDLAFPILFETTANSSLPETLTAYGSVAPMGQQERIGNVITETITRGIDGRALKTPRAVQHAGIQSVSLFRFDPPRIPVATD